MSLSPTKQAAFGESAICMNRQSMGFPSNRLRTAMTARCPQAHRAPSGELQILLRGMSMTPIKI
jgi:hypothetical protein